MNTNHAYQCCQITGASCLCRFGRMCLLFGGHSVSAAGTGSGDPKPKTVDYFHKICPSPPRTPASIHTSDARLWPPRVFADFGDGASCVVAHRSLLVPARQAKIIEIELSRARMPVSTTQICNGNIGRVLHDHLNAVVQASRPDSAF